MDLLPALWLVLAVACTTGLLDTTGFRLLVAPDRRPILPLLAAHYSSEAVLKTIPAGLPIAEAVRVRMLARSSGVPPAQGIAAVLSRRLYLGTAQGVYLIAATLLGFSVLHRLSFSLLGRQGAEWGMLVLPVLLTAALGALLLLTTSGTLFQRVTGALQRLRVPKLRAWLAARSANSSAADTFLRALPAPTSRPFWKTMAFFFLAWVTEACETFLLFRVLGIPVSVPEAVAVEALVSTAKLLAFFLPSGILVQDTGYAGVMVAMGMAGGLEAAVPFVLLKRAKDLVFIAAGYLILAAHGIKPVRRLLRVESA